MAVAPVLLAPAHPLGGLGDGEGVPPGGGEEAHASGDPLQHQGHGGGRQGEREQRDHMVWRNYKIWPPTKLPRAAQIFGNIHVNHDYFCNSRNHLYCENLSPQRSKKKVHPSIQASIKVL